MLEANFEDDSLLVDIRVNTFTFTNPPPTPSPPQKKTERKNTVQNLQEENLRGATNTLLGST